MRATRDELFHRLLDVVQEFIAAFPNWENNIPTEVTNHYIKEIVEIRRELESIRRWENADA